MFAKQLGICAAALSVVLVSCTNAVASHTQESIFQDGALTSMSPAARGQALDELKALGVDTLHVLINWKDVAPSPGAKRKPRHFHGDRPDDYRPSAWKQYDDLLLAAKARGFDILLTPNGPAPRWAEPRRPKGGLASYEPNARQFGRFVRATGRRYSGAFARTTDDQTLPRVERWSCFNEPNQGGWLQPQSARSPLLGRMIPRSPQIYRKLYGSCYRGLKNSGHGNDQILLGELAPLGSRRPSRLASLAPGLFLREMFCLDSNYRPFTGLARIARGCQNYRKIRATGIAHHPYIKKPFQPTSRLKHKRDWMPIGATARLFTLLHKSAARGRVSAGLPVYFTEFGVQTDPPDSYAGVSLDEQSEFINVAEHIAYKFPQVRSWAQYVLCDDPPPYGGRPDYYSGEPFGGFQSGLKFEDCKPKPALDAYRLPIDALRISANRVRIWGLVRPFLVAQQSAGAPIPAAAIDTKQVQVEVSSGKSFVAAGPATAIANPRGYFEQAINVPNAAKRQWRFSWVDSNGSIYRSRIASPRKP